MKMRMTRRGAGILIALMLIAVPAAAAVMTQNFVSATIELNGKCFTMTDGADASSPTGWVTFTPNVVNTGSVDLAQEVITVNGFGGNRMIYSDVALLENNCAQTATVDFISAGDPGGAAAFEPALGDAVWDDFTIRIFLANTQTPDNNVFGADWVEALSVDGGVASDGGSVAIPNGSDRRLAVVIDTDDAVDTFLPDAATLRWTAQILFP